MTRDEAIKDIEENILPVVGGKSLRMAIDALKQPERKTGKWVNNIHYIPTCNQCGYMTPYDRAIDDYEYGNFCPNCGAKMEDEEAEEADLDYERAVMEYQHNILYEPTFNPEDGSM